MAFPELQDADHQGQPFLVVSGSEKSARLRVDRTNMRQRVPELTDYIAEDWRAHVDKFPACSSFEEY